MTQEIVPFLKWAGGKRWFVAQHPDMLDLSFKRYLEPFLGSGAAFFYLKPRSSILSDLNPNLIATYQAIRDEWSKVELKLKAHHREHAKDPENYYYRMRASKPTSKSGRAARFIYLNRTCFNGLYRVNLDGVFNVPRGTKSAVSMPSDNFAGISGLLQKAILCVGDFETILNQGGEGDFAFVDPPYTVKHNYNGFLKYNEVIFSWADQTRLALAVNRFAARGGIALVTNAAHSSIRNLYSEIGEIKVITRNSVLASDSARRAKIEEFAITVRAQDSNAFDAPRQFG